MIQANTDGLTVRVRREHQHLVEYICDWWQQYTGLELEEAIYSRMMIKDVNNYIAEYEGGGLKRKGAYEYELGWHQNHSALVISKAAEAAMVKGITVEEFIHGHTDMMDFMLRAKIPKSSRLVLNVGGIDHPLQNTTRYYVSNDPRGGQLVKIMPPLKQKMVQMSDGSVVKNTKKERGPLEKKGYVQVGDVFEQDGNYRRTGIDVGWTVTPCNDIKDAIYPINYDYYIQEAKKLVIRT